MHALPTSPRAGAKRLFTLVAAAIDRGGGLRLERRHAAARRDGCRPAPPAVGADRRPDARARRRPGRSSSRSPRPRTSRPGTR